ncbi:Fe-S oxidoreductase [Candidatus Magnetoovum chiemensis]|nr:Fe-S oxidoreductase [Candidatus Magnetoovum chiemensis]
MAYLLLINPPFASPVTPYPSIPVLVPYLRGKSVEVDVFDANIEFYQEFLSSENIKNGKLYSKERIKELVEKPHLSPDELEQYKSLLKAQRYDFLRKTDQTKILDYFSDGIKINHDFLNATLSLTASPYFPQRIDSAEFSFINYKSAYSEFSSKDILRSVRKENDLLDPFFKQRFKEMFSVKKPLIAGISIYFQSQVLAAFNCARVIKSIAPQVHVTIGGAFVSCFMRDIKNSDLFTVIDSIVIDDGEIPLERLITELSSSKPDLAKVPGLIYLQDCEIRKNDTSKYIPLALLPTPDYSVFDIKKYFGYQNGMRLSARLCRGCYWAKCTFCRTKMDMICHYDEPSEDFIVNQISEIVESTGVHSLHFCDESAPPILLERLCRKITEQALNINWLTHLRFDAKLTLDRLLTYREAGCVTAVFGLEAYNDRILRLMKKGTNIALIERILSDVSWSGISSFVYMIVGFPTETEQEALSAHDKIQDLMSRSLIQNCVYNTFRITAGSPIYDNPSEFGITKIYSDEEKDLSPNLFFFDAQGMSRQKAIELERLFNQNLKAGNFNS